MRGAQLLEGDELLLVAIDQTPQDAPGARQVALEARAAVDGWVGGAKCREPPLDLRFDRRGVLQQREHPGTDQLVHLGHADPAIVANTPLRAPELSDLEQR